MSTEDSTAVSSIAIRPGSDVEILRQIRLAGVRPFMDKLQGPCVELPLTTAPRRWLVDSDRTKAWVAKFVLEKLKISIEATQLRQILLLLKADAYDGPVEKADLERLWQEVERHPVLKALFTFIDRSNPTCSYWEGRTEDLLKLLKSTAIEIGVWTDSKEWPSLTRLLTFKLNKKEETISGLGVCYRQFPTRTGSYTRLTWDRELIHGIAGRDGGDAGDGAVGMANEVADHVNSRRCDAGDAGDGVNEPGLSSRLRDYESEFGPRASG